MVATKGDGEHNFTASRRATEAAFGRSRVTQARLEQGSDCSAGLADCTTTPQSTANKLEACASRKR